MTDEQYPEHVKLRAVKEQSQVCGEFFEWLQSTYRIEVGEGLMMPSVQKVLAEFFEIDLKKLSAEKDAMVESLRR